MKKTLIICSGIWLSVILICLIAGLFNAEGLFIALLTLIFLVMGVTLLDIIIQFKIRKAFLLCSNQGAYLDSLQALKKMEKWPLTKNEKDFLLLSEIVCLQLSGDPDKAPALKDKIPFESLKSKKMRYTWLMVMKDNALIKEDEDAYLSLDRIEREDRKAQEEALTKEEKESAFYFLLLKGQINRDEEEEVMSFLKEEASLGRAEDLFYRYIGLMIKLLRHQELIGLEAFIRDSQGTYLEEKGQELKEKGLALGLVSSTGQKD
ncbi:MAG: hypothetical protein LKJ88_04910 [Bacilli bacterium]|jgi:hypothetical protein|nr:hypothetical protein [Bacilli bacterium]